MTLETKTNVPERILKEDNDKDKGEKTKLESAQGTTSEWGVILDVHTYTTLEVSSRDIPRAPGLCSLETACTVLVLRLQV